MSAKTKPIAPLDAGWLWLESAANHMHGSIVCVFDKPRLAGSDYVANLVEQMREHTVPTAPFDRRLDTSRRRRLRPRWEIVEEVDLDYHLQHVRLPKGAGEEAFGALISELHGEPLDHAHPLWMIHVIDGLEGNRFAVFGKMHHALADGVAALGIVRAWLSPDKGARDLPPIWAYRRPERRASGGAGKRRWRGPKLGATLRGVRYAIRGVAARPYTAPRTALNTPITARRRVETNSYDLARFRAVADRHDATINDVVLAVCGGALRAYLEDVATLPEKSLITNIPVSVRTGTNGAGGNAISWAMLPLATDIADPRARIEQIREASSGAKTRIAGMGPDAVERYTLLAVAPILVEQLTRTGGRMRPQFNVPISNVPGPPAALYLNGARMSEIQALTVIYGGQALNITTLSYDDRLDFAMTACADALPHVDILAAACEAALAELEAV